MGHKTNAILCYGWIDEYGEIMRYETLEDLSNYINKKNDNENFYLGIYSDELSYGMCDMAIYGVNCDINSETGLPIISEMSKKMVKESYKVWCEKKGCLYCENNIKFHLAISGDPEFNYDELTIYNLDFSE